MSNINGLNNQNPNSVYLFSGQGQTGGVTGNQGSQGSQGTQSASLNELIKDVLEVVQDVVALQHQGQSSPLMNDPGVSQQLQSLLGGQGGQAGQGANLNNLLQLAQNALGMQNQGGQQQSTQSDLMSFLNQGSNQGGLGQSGSSQSGLGQSGLMSGQGLGGLQSLANTLGSGNGSGTNGGLSLGGSQLESASIGQNGQAGKLSNEVAYTDGKDFSIESKGDPHLKATIDGVETKNDNMGSQSDLIDANSSFVGGYQVSTTVTGADDKGKTYNQKVGVQTDGNTISVEHKDDGDPNVTVTNNATGSARTLNQGDQLTTDHGATINYGKDGKVQIINNNSDGGTISTTVSDNGHGLDSTTGGKNVRIGGFEAAYAGREHATGTSSTSVG